MDFHSTRPLVLLVAFGSGLAFSEACKSSKANSNHCSLLDGDDTCAERYPGELVHCGGDCVDSENGDGCVMDAPTDLDCWYPCGDDQTADDDMSCLGTTMTDTIATTVDSTDSDPSGDPTTADTTATTMGSMTDPSETDATETTESGGDCQASADCLNAAFPVCLDHDCVACTDTPNGNMACTAKDEGLPVCTDTGECVQCNDGNAAACTGTTPVCDAGTSACVGCTYHEQCSGTACDIETGACFDCTVDVNDGESISLAIEDDCVLIIHAGVYPESVQIGPGTKVALLAAEGEVAGITGVGLDNAPALDITGDAVVYVQDLRFTANDLGVGVSVDTGTLYLDRARVVSNAGGGLVLTNGASATVRNTFVGGSSADTAAIDVDGSTATIIYSTLVGYDDSFGGGTALRCTDPMMVVVRNSLIAKTGVGPEIECADASVSYTATEGATPGAGNVALTSITMGWFDDLAGGDYHLNAPPADLAMTAVWLTGDPSGDVDAEPRPAVDGSMDYAGADVPAK